jgi:hypothetical protein
VQSSNKSHSPKSSALISSDHNALLICGSSDGVAPRVQALSKSRRVVKFYDVREQHIMCLIVKL